MQKACAVVGNRDIELFVPNLISCMARPSEVPDCITKVSGTTFVQVAQLYAITQLVLKSLLRCYRFTSRPWVGMHDDMFTDLQLYFLSGQGRMSTLLACNFLQHNVYLRL